MPNSERHPEDKDNRSPIEKSVSRREFLKIAAIAGLAVGLGGALAACSGTAATTTAAAIPPATAGTAAPGATTTVSGSGEAGTPQPTDAVEAVIEAIAGYPLAGLGEVHMSQQFHDFLSQLLPKLPGRVNDIVVEFGNAHYQDVADRFILDLEPVGSDELAQIWRTAVGGLVLWDAPVYEHFYRCMRTLNASLPAAQRIRVLLGDPDVDWVQIKSAADRDKIPTEAQREPFFAGVVEHEVLARGHRALLIAGADHLRRYEYASPGGFNPSPDARQPNVATLLSDAHPGSLYLIFPLAGRSPGSPDITKVDAAFGDWPHPSIAPVAGTWLATESVTYRLVDPGKSAFGLQVDAVLWLGPEETLTESLPDAALYKSGPYADELRRLSPILSAVSGQSVDLVALGLQLAAGGGRSTDKGSASSPTK